MPVTVPVLPIVAIEELPLCQVPPLTVADRVVEPPVHSVVEPVIEPGDGSGLTDITLVA